MDNFVKWAATIGGDCLNTQSRQLASTTYRRADNVKQPDDVSKFEKNRAFGRSGGGGETYINEDAHVFLNHAPFSFDLSVFDLYLTLYTGGTLFAIPGFVQQNMELYLDCLQASDADVWVSTPSSAELALLDCRFKEDLLPDMRMFLFCGETLTAQTARKLRRLFPDALVINTYGPTESTVAITSVEVTEDICEKYNPLPIGYVKPGTQVFIMNGEGEILPDGKKGEIVIAGNTVSIGYWKNPLKTQEVFNTIEYNGHRFYCYHTHDKGYYEDGMLFYCGRIDLQIKLHGFRIELEDIESNILRISGVERAVVLPDKRDDKIVSLTAYVVMKEKVQSRIKARKYIRTHLLESIPEYMVPRNYVFIDSLPMTVNGKVDRKKLEGMKNVQS